MRLRLDVVGANAQRLAEGFDRLFRSPVAPQGEPEIHVQVGVARLQGDRLAEFVHRLLVASKTDQRHAKIIMGLGVIALELQRAVEAFDRLRETTNRLADGAQQIPNIRLIGLNADRVQVTVLGRAKIALDMCLPCIVQHRA